MLKSMPSTTSPETTHDDHLKRLLDQRTTRADVRPCFPSSTSDFSDSPSIYSHAYFSPRSTASHNGDQTTDYASFADERPSLDDGNGINALALSMLDDRRSSYASTIMEEAVSTRFIEPEDDTLDTRMSMLGPKMRVHSKAPWELDEDPLEEEDEDDSVSSRGKPSPVRSAFGFTTKRSIFGRSSGESSIPKPSFESTLPYSRNTAYSEQTNLSATSLVYPSQQPTPSFVSTSTPTSPTSPPAPPSKYLVDSPESLQRPKPLSPAIDNSLYRQDSHPYANPDLQSSYEKVPRATLSVKLPHSPRSESISTIRDAQPPTPLPKDTPAPGSPWPGVLKGTSSPLANTTKPSNDSVLATWSENSPSPGFSLISLEEARLAQHARSATASSTRTSDSSAEDTAANVRSRSRIRTMSAGSRAKQAINNMVGSNGPERRESEPTIVASGSGQGKSLKHKKSGLMRLFNGGRDEKESPPPVPSVPDGVAKYNAHHVVPPRTPKLSTGASSLHRVPVPTISPPTSPISRITSPKPMPPPLLITPSSSKGTIVSPGASSSVSEELLVPPRLHFAEEGSQSAPPQVSAFPALKLRPVSSLFSTPFGEHVLAASDAPSPQIPQTSSFGSNLSSDPEAVIRSLQNQLSSSNKSWQQQVWELKGQIRDLKAELDDVRTSSAQDAKRPCDACGRGRKSSFSDASNDTLQVGGGSVVNRPRARTGNTGAHARFGAGH